MSDIRDMLENEVRDLRPPPDLEPVHRRARQRHRRRRVGSAIVAFAVAGAGTAGAWLAVNGLRQGGDRRGPSVGGTWDGGRILYDCDPEHRFPFGALPGPALCAMRPDGSDRAVVVPQPTADPRHLLVSISDPAWSPDGTRFVYRLSDPDACERCSDLFVADADGTGVRRLTSGAQASSPAWSPDGSTIAFATVGGSIDTIGADGSNPQTLTPCTCNGGTTVDSNPTWSPDGARIAFVRAEPDQPPDLWVMNADGSDPQLVASGAEVGGSIVEPSWGPDGVLIAFAVGEASGSTSLWTIDGRPQMIPDPKDRPHRLFGDGERSFDPEWIDGGAQVAFLHGSDTASALESVRVDDGTVSTLVGDFPGHQFAFQPPPGGAAGACVDPGPAQFIPCSEALPRAEDSGFPGGAGSRIDVTLVHRSPRVGPGAGEDPRWMWAVAYHGIHASQGEGAGQPVIQDYVVDIDATTGNFDGVG
jgi:WD40-like Beta Propeller Repeat